MKTSLSGLAASLAIVVLCSSPDAMADLDISANLSGDIFRNQRGGLATGTAVLADAGVQFNYEYDTGNDVGNRAFAYLLWNNASTFSDRYSGDAQVVSNIDAPAALRVYEFWYQLQLGNDSTLRIGLYDLNSEFDAMATSALFINSSHGIGAEYAQSGRAGPSIFPVTSLAARVNWALSESSSVRYAILDGVPGDPNDISRTTIDLGGGDGVLHALELNYGHVGGARIGIGGWLYSADFNRIEAQPGASRDDGNSGLYAFVETPLYASDNGMQLDGFLRYGVANDDFNPFERYVGAGVVATGLLPSRPDDRFGIALASAGTGAPFKRAVGGAAGHETSIELTWSTQVTDWLRVQPDIQYVINPGVDPVLDDALVVGIRFELTASRTFRARWR